MKSRFSRWAEKLRPTHTQDNSLDAGDVFVLVVALFFLTLLLIKVVR